MQQSVKLIFTTTSLLVTDHRSDHHHRPTSVVTIHCKMRIIAAKDAHFPQVYILIMRNTTIISVTYCFLLEEREDERKYDRKDDDKKMKAVQR